MNPDIETINQTLGYLGQAPVDDINANVFSRLAGTFWGPSVKQVLRAHPWNFAVTRVVLAPMVDAPAFGYGAQFELPGDWLRTLEVSEKDYRQEGRRILCDAVTLNVKYIALIDDVTRFDALFCAALARNIASKLAYPITKSTTQQEAQWAAYTQELAYARTVDAQEEPAEDMEESSLITVRG